MHPKRLAQQREQLRYPSGALFSSFFSGSVSVPLRPFAFGRSPWALAFGALSISSEAGYGGVGPNFLPWLVSIVLTLCGAWIIWESRTGGFREMDPPTDAVGAYWPGFVWVTAGLLLNAALITTLGFILSCALCYLLAVQGLRRAAGQPQANSPRA